MVEGHAGAVSARCEACAVRCGVWPGHSLRERAISPVDGSVAYVVIDESYRVHAEASEYLGWLRSTDRSRNTERVYAGRLALFLTYCANNRLDWRTVTSADLGRFLKSLVAEPLRPEGARSAGSEAGLRFRSNKTANAIFTAVCEFLRFAATREWVSKGLADSLHRPKFLMSSPFVMSGVVVRTIGYCTHGY